MSSYYAALVLAIAMLVPLPEGAAGAAPDPALAPAADYGDPGHWLCWPGRADACTTDLTATVIDAAGGVSLEAFHPLADPPVDCFYVYPTVSSAPGATSELVATADERAVAATQAARLAARCRVYAPLYRQRTVAALRAVLRGHPLAGSQDPATRDLGYRDVEAAWRYYLDHENHGRGVVLIGHSQGASVLGQLLREHIDGQPDQARIVSAMLIGTRVLVPQGSDVGGDLRAMPLCRQLAQTGCVISYSSFRDRLPPPSPPRAPYFGYSDVPGMSAACVNPAALGGGVGELHAYLRANPGRAEDPASEPWRWSRGVEVKSPFVSVPGMLSARCVVDGAFSYLAVKVTTQPDDLRGPDIPGDVYYGNAVRAEWGLHLVDVGLALGNLLDVIAAQSRSWVAQHP